MVLGVCRRVIGDDHDSEDAFQATFVVLVRKAGAIKPRELVGHWLYGVAYRTALAARALRARRSARERQVANMPQPLAQAEQSRTELQWMIDDELNRLPAKLRAAVVLCELEGRSRKDVARQLGIPEGTLSSRLAAARRRLATQLSRRGVTLTTGALAALVPGIVPPRLLATTVHAATTGATTATVADLTHRVAKAMLVVNLQRILMSYLPVLMLLAASAVGWYQHLAAAQLPSASTNRVQLSSALENQGPSHAKPLDRIFVVKGKGRILALPFNKGKAGPLEEVTPLDAAPYSKFGRLSPDGTRFATAHATALDPQPVRVAAFELCTFALRIREFAKADEGELIMSRECMEIFEFAWSPDGERVAFTSIENDKGNPFRNWIANVRTKRFEEVKLPTVKTSDGNEAQLIIQAWSPDGQRFLARGDYGLHLVNTDGKAHRRLLDIPKTMPIHKGSPCRFAPDGKKVVYVVHGWDGSTVYVADVSLGESKAVVQIPNYFSIRASWSPDGKSIAYSASVFDANRQSTGETKLIVIDADGGNPVEVLTERNAQGSSLTLLDWR
jgi:RNA polymerase sigma factor (sigma-70 family)